MNYKKKIAGFIGLTIIAFLFALVLEYLSIYSLDDIQQFIGLFSIITFFILLILYLCKESVFLAWRKFALWYLPIAVALVALAPSNLGGLGAFEFGFDKELTTWWLSSIFFIVSLILIIRTSRKVKREEVMKR